MSDETTVESRCDEISLILLEKIEDLLGQDLVHLDLLRAYKDTLETLQAIPLSRRRGL
jgi:predicted ArsR family transcriptional regulator